ncbi:MULTISPECIES: hypothetical protein [Acinetobacter]|uniref:Uncharacterized protein n=1 Tax=Acinetobacter higginsii TaxID=70347 RepID=N9RJJ5_9GAMM|nr:MULTISPECIES: hypothetical protein [Acinetobacter]ENX58148.1 hypothetical protein F902_02548 [Acinetobacter higginsii]
MSENECSLREDFAIEIIGSISQELHDYYSTLIWEAVRFLSKNLNLDRLDGMTFTYGDELFRQKLKEFDERLKPSADEGFGVAMTISSINGDFERNYIVVNLQPFGVEFLQESFSEEYDSKSRNLIYNQFIHTIYHELCHVACNKLMYDKFYDFATKLTVKNELEQVHVHTTNSSWNEFFVCSLANEFGLDQEKKYESILLDVMNNFEENLNYIFKSYLSRSNQNDNTIYSDLFHNTYALIHRLFKYSSYYLGDIFTKENVEISQSIKNHELWQYVNRLNSILKNIYEKILSETAEESDFHKIGELAEEFAGYLGLIAYPTEGNGLFVNLSIPTQARLLNS